MKFQLVALVVFLAALGRAQEQTTENIEDDSHVTIRHILEDNSKTLQQLDSKAHLIGNAQKGIENKLRLLGQDVAGIGRLEDGLKKLEQVTLANFQIGAMAIKNLTANLRSNENKTERAIISLARGQQEVKQGLVKVEDNQNKFERSLDQVANGVNQRLSALDNLIKQSVLKELVVLIQGARKIEQSQRNIESKVAHLDELTGLIALTANKVQLVELGLRSINSTASRQLASIGHTVKQLGSSHWQIDNKLGVLLSTQKNIERALVECKRSALAHQQPEAHRNQWEQSSFVTYKHKDQKLPAKNSHGQVDDDSHVYNIW